MLGILAESIGLLTMAITGFFIINNFIGRDIKLQGKDFLIMIISIIIPLCIFDEKYSSIYTIVTFLVNIMMYKIIFKKEMAEVVIYTGIVMILMLLSDIICGIILINFFDIEKLRGIWYFRIILNVIVATVSIIIYQVLQLKKLYKYIDNKLKNDNFKVMIVLTLLILVFSIIMFNLYKNFKYNEYYFSNIILVIIFFIILYIFIIDKTKYTDLIKKYDNLFIYVQNFEDWIEKEQLNRHEFKNQLAVLRSVTKDTNTRKKIDEILKDNIEIEDEIIDQLKKLPKGGIKGLMYYKSAIAQKNKLNLVIDVSINSNSALNHLNKNDTQTLCKLIGIYYDNAIEAAKETRKKNILIEIYEVKNQTNIVISNTFKKAKNFNNRNEKGISSKGKGRGNGLYFAKSLLDKNKWIEENQEIIDRYYIETLHIKTRK